MVWLPRSIGNGVDIGYVEVKAPGGSQSDKQKKFQTRCEVAGIYYSVVRSVENVKEITL